MGIPSFQSVTNVKDLTKRLQERRYPGPRLSTQVLADETHFSVIPATFGRGSRAVFPRSVWERGREDTRRGTGRQGQLAAVGSRMSVGRVGSRWEEGL
jgi:hypothetical protein